MNLYLLIFSQPRGGDPGWGRLVQWSSKKGTSFSEGTKNSKNQNYCRLQEFCVVG